MKTKIILLLFFSCLFSAGILAEFLQTTRPTGPNSPLIYESTRMYTNVSRVLTYQKYMMGREIPDCIPEVFVRSEDNLTDTVYYDLPYQTSAGIEFARQPVALFLRFNENNQLLHMQDIYVYNPEYPYKIENFEYDDEGRLFKHVTKWIDPVAKSEEVIDLIIHDFSTIQKTEKGYIFEDWEYSFDDQGRMIFCRSLDGRFEPDHKFKEEYITFNDGKEYLKNATYFSYTDSSYTSLVYFKKSVIEKPSKDWWVEATYTFYKNGLLKSHIVNTSLDGVDWYIWNYHEYKYEYINDNEMPITYASDDVKNDAIKNTNTIVNASYGTVCVVTEKAALVQIFDISGRLVKQQAVSQGENRINVPSSGLYFVKVGNESFKIFVR